MSPLADFPKGSNSHDLRQGTSPSVAPRAAHSGGNASISALAVMVGAVAVELTEVVLAWPRLSAGDKARVLAILRGADSAERGAGQ